jgi:hypothetical protein
MAAQQQGAGGGEDRAWQLAHGAGRLALHVQLYIERAKTRRMQEKRAPQFICVASYIENLRLRSRLQMTMIRMCR